MYKFTIWPQKEIEKLPKIKNTGYFDSSGRPISDGLFCERIFGPIKDYSCACGKIVLSSPPKEQIFCPVCHVEITKSDVRRERMARIELYFPVANPLFWRQRTDIYNLIPLKFKQVQSILNFELVYLDGELVSIDKFFEKYQKDSKYLLGAEIIEFYLNSFLNENKKNRLEALLKLETKEKEKEKIKKAIKIIDNCNPLDTIIRHLPVIPAGIRVYLELEGEIIIDNITHLYTEIFIINENIKKLQESLAPLILLINAYKDLQRTVDILFMKERLKIKSKRWEKITSITGSLVGKDGLLRNSLLGKRVDYSGRSVIVPDPTLSYNEVRLPFEFLEMWRYYFVREGVWPKNKSLNVFKIPKETLNKIIKEIEEKELVLLNRQPTLHRPSIQKFKPKFWDKKAIGLHPCYCPPFNADFDGDTMAVYALISEKSKKEFEKIPYDIVSPANNKPLIKLHQDMILGLYLLTEKEPEKEKIKGIYDFDEAVNLISSYEAFSGIDFDDTVIVFYKGEKILTTFGRVLFNSFLPEKMRFINKPVDKKIINDILLELKNFGEETYLKYLDELKKLGFEIATIKGFTFEFNITENMKQVIKEFKEKKEKETNLINLTNETINKLEKELEKTNIYKCVKSGARASIDQIVQFIFKGMMVVLEEKKTYIIIDKGYYEGLSPIDYFESSKASRRTLSKQGVADAGYLTRRLIEALYPIKITEEDCGELEHDILLCKSKKGVCAKCYGDYSSPFVGILAAQSIGEPGTQMTLRLAKLGGAIKIIGSKFFKIESPIDGRVKFEDVETITEFDEFNKPLNKVIHSFKNIPKLIIYNSNEEKVIYLPECYLQVKDNEVVKKGQTLAIIPEAIFDTDITSGIEEVNKIIENKKLKRKAIISEIDGKVKIDYKEKNILITVYNDLTQRKYIVPYSVFVIPKDGDFIKAGERLTSGEIDIMDIMKTKGILEAQKFLVEKLKQIYSLYGIDIDEKHFKILVREMFKIRIGDKVLRRQELPDLGLKEKFRYEIFGVKKLAFLSDSPLARLSFEDVLRQLPKIALYGEVEKFEHPKSRLMIGYVIK